MWWWCNFAPLSEDALLVDGDDELFAHPGESRLRHAGGVDQLGLSVGRIVFVVHGRHDGRCWKGKEKGVVGGVGGSGGELWRCADANPI